MPLPYLYDSTVYVPWYHGTGTMVQFIYHGNTMLYPTR